MSIDNNSKSFGILVPANILFKLFSSFLWLTNSHIGIIFEFLDAVCNKSSNLSLSPSIYTPYQPDFINLYVFEAEPYPMHQIQHTIFPQKVQVTKVQIFFQECHLRHFLNKYYVYSH